MKTLIDVNRNVWGKVKNFATVKELTLNSAVELLLKNALGRGATKMSFKMVKKK
jgi:hypothetical protein